MVEVELLEDIAKDPMAEAGLAVVLGWGSERHQLPPNAAARSAPAGAGAAAAAGPTAMQEDSQQDAAVAAEAR